MLYLLLGVYGIVSGILVIVGGVWMKDSQRCKTGGIVAVIFSVVGSGTLLGLVGGILGIVEGAK